MTNYRAAGRRLQAEGFRFCFSLIFVFFTIQAFSQKNYPQGYFQSPMDMRLLLSGTFGELRTNHFHSGIDIKTSGVEGAKVYAIADGYVSRIKISYYGFGKALYVTHPNGYVSVYGHLSGYNKTIGDFIRKEQYSRESYEVEIYPDAGAIPVKKGEIIAYSGNSGSSGGPHLHFEIRDEGSQKPINPLLFGYDVKDFYKPRITAIKVYPEDRNAKVNGKGEAKFYPVEGWGVEHKITGSPLIKVSGNISFAVQTFDQQNDTDNKNGPFSVALYLDGRLVSRHIMESFSFDDTRYANSLIDYTEYMKNDVRLQRTKIDPGNKLDIYSGTVNKGIITFEDTLTHNMKYEVADAAGNVAQLAFRVKSEKPSGISSEVINSGPVRPDVKFPVSNFNYGTANQYNTSGFKLECPAGVFYDSFTFTYDTLKRIPGTYSPVHKIHNKYTPVHSDITLSVKPYGLPAGLEGKALMVKVNDDGKTYKSAGGKFEARSGTVVTKIREFGNYTVAVDTVTPKIKAVQPEVFTKMAGQKYIKLTITDELSGIAGYKATLNGRWILMEYDPKSNMLTYTIDDYLVPGKNTLLVEVSDARGNRSLFAATLIL